MTPVTWIAGGLAALVAGIAILIKGGMAEKPGVRAGAFGSHGAAGSTASGDEGGAGGGMPLPQDPLPTQTTTGKLGNGEGWGSNAVSEPSVSYSSDGDGNGGTFLYPTDPGHGKREADPWHPAPLPDLHPSWLPIPSGPITGGQVHLPAPSSPGPIVLTFPTSRPRSTGTRTQVPV